MKSKMVSVYRFTAISIIGMVSCGIVFSTSFAQTQTAAQMSFKKRHATQINRSINRMQSRVAQSVGYVNVDASNLSGPQSETNICIDYSNPSRILAGSNDIAGAAMRAYYSTDYGASFSGSAPSLVASGVTFDFTSDPALDFDLNGNAYYTYLVIKNDGIRGGLVVAKSTTGGASWNTPATIAIHTTTSPSTPFDDKCMMTIDKNSTSTYKNNIYVVWDRIDNSGAHVMFSKSANAGTSYSSPVRIDDTGTTPNGYGNIYAAPAVGPNGEIYVIWDNYDTNGNNDKLVLDKSSDGGNTWGTDKTVVSNLIVDVFSGFTAYFLPSQPDRGIAACPSIDVDRSNGSRRGWVYLVWCDASSNSAKNDTNIYFSRSTNGGSSWSSKVKVNDDNTNRSQFFSWLSVDPQDGSINISWYDCRDDSSNKKTNVYYTRSTDGGNTFQSNVKVSNVQSDESGDNANRDNGNNYGDYEGIVAYKGVAYPVWTDTRDGLATNGTEEVYVASILYGQVKPGFYASPPSGEGPLTVNFIDTSANNPVTWNWNFGDGGSSSIQNPQHIYTAVSVQTSYTVQLILNSGSITANTATYLNYVTITPSNPPAFGDLPDLKLFAGQPLPNAFDLLDYNTSDAATSFSVLSSFLSLATNVGSVISQDPYGTPTVGSNVYEGDNPFGSSTVINEVKYSTYKIAELPQVVLRPGTSKSINVFNYTTDSTLNHVVPTSFGLPEAIIVGDTTQISAVWSDVSTVLITALAGFNVPVDVDIIASPAASAPFGVDIDKEKIGVYPSLSTTAYEFSNAGDTTLFSFQVPSGATGLPSISRVSTVNDPVGSSSNGGALKITFSSPTSGIKITPAFSAWLSNTPGSFYTLRARVFGTSTTNNYLQLLYNGNPGKSPTDVQGYFMYSVPTVWTYIDIPVSSFSSVSSSPVMYPQIVLKANGGTGSIYIDEMEIFQGTPALLGASRYITTDKYVGGFWNDSSATTKWATQKLSGSPSFNVANGALFVNTSGATQSGIKFTASTANLTIYTITRNPGKQVGMHMKTKLVAGNADVSFTQVQVNLLGAKAANSFSVGGDIASAAEIGRVSDRTLKLAFTPAIGFYQIQFVVKNSGNSTLQVDNTEADVDNNDPNYGDATLFP